MKYQKIIDQLTLEEKAALLGGKSEWESRDIPRLNICYVTIDIIALQISAGGCPPKDL